MMNADAFPFFDQQFPSCVSLDDFDGDEEEEDPSSDISALHKLKIDLRDDSILFQTPLYETNEDDKHHKSSSAPRKQRRFQHIEIELHETFTSALSESNLQLLETTLSNCGSALRSLTLERSYAISPTNYDTTLQVSVRTLLRLLRLPNTIHLTDLRLWDTLLQGTRDDWNELAEWIDTHLRHLGFLCFVEPRQWVEHHVPKGALDPLAQVVSTHSGMRFLESNFLLTSRPGISLPMVDLFCQFSDIAGLHLLDIDVDIDPSRTGGGHERTATFLKGMKTNPHCWDFGLSFTKPITTRYATAIAELFHSNRHITHMTLTTAHHPIPNDSLQILLSAFLNSNTKIKDLTLDAGPSSLEEGLSEENCNLLVNILKTKPQLCQLSLKGPCLPWHVQATMETYHRLNNAGRRGLLRDFSLENDMTVEDIHVDNSNSVGDSGGNNGIILTGNKHVTKVRQEYLEHQAMRWIWVLADQQVHDHVDCIYHLLSLYPAVIYGARQQARTQKQQQQQQHQQHQLAPEELTEGRELLQLLVSVSSSTSSLGMKRRFDDV